MTPATNLAGLAPQRGREVGLSRPGDMTDEKPDIRLIAIDLDKTLLDESLRVPERNRAALAAAAERGVTVAIATGRTHSSAARLARQLGINAPIISYNGAMIRRADDPEPMRHVRLEADLAAEIVELLVHQMTDFMYFVDEKLYVQRYDHWARGYRVRTGDRPCVAGDLRRFAGAAPTKLLLLGTPEQTRARYDYFTGRYDGRIYATISLPEYMEILNPQATKATALRWLAERLDIPMRCTMAVGDSLNDLEMIRAAGVGVFMPFADEELRAEADFVPSDPVAGVAGAVETLVLGREAACESGGE